MNVTLRTVSFAVLMPLTLSLCAAAPPEEGAEFRGSAGHDYFEYQTGGCGTPGYVNRAHQGSGSVALSHRSESGLTVAGEASAGVARVVDSTLDSVPEGGIDVDDPTGDEGRTIVSGLVVGRVGYHDDHFGLELGAGVGRNLLPEYDDAVTLIPSTRVWVGAPDYVYAFAEAGTAPGSAAYLPATFGLGHASEEVRFEAGYGGPSAIMLQGQIPAGDDVWLGARLYFATFQAAEQETLQSGGASVTLSTSF